MFKILRQLFSILTVSQRNRFYKLQILMVVTALAEIVGVASIVPFMALIGDISLLAENQPLNEIFHLSGLESEKSFVFLLGLLVLVFLVFSALISMFTTWRLAMFATQTGTELSDRLYQYYLGRPWLFHTATSSAELTKKVANETGRVTSQILYPILQINARLVLAIFMCVAMFSYDPKVAALGILIVFIGYVALYRSVRKRLHINGLAISRVFEQRFRLMSEGFGGIRDVILSGKRGYFSGRFKDTGEVLATSQGLNTALAQVPRYLMELVAFGSMLSLVLYLMVVHDGELGFILPILSVYALAGMKLLPAFQQIYSRVAVIKGNISAFESVYDDLTKTNPSYELAVAKRPKISGLPLEKSISLKNVCFTYPGSKQEILKGINISIPANTTTGIVGPSGAGKSTLLDVLLGLIKPDRGEFHIDEIQLWPDKVRLWQNSIGFVSQTLHLTDGTIAENVAFGIPPEDIDYQRVMSVLELARLANVLLNADKGLNTSVGERGVKLSGGQRQRLAIARALYHDPEVLIFDEATSALDGVTEKEIMDAIHQLNGKKTIILVAHRIRTVESCDQIVVIDNGSVVGSGAYTELLSKNETFKKLAR